MKHMSQHCCMMSPPAAQTSQSPADPTDYCTMFDLRKQIRKGTQGTSACHNRGTSCCCLQCVYNSAEAEGGVVLGALHQGAGQAEGTWDAGVTQTCDLCVTLLSHTVARQGCPQATCALVAN
jgi:hypothetical protein